MASTGSAPPVPAGKSVTAVLVSTPGDLSDVRAGVNMLKGLVGFGILALPWASAQVGLLPSCVGMALIAFGTLSGILLSAIAKDRLDGSGSELEMLVQEGKLADPSAADAWGSGLGFFDKLVGQVLGFGAQVVCIAGILMLQFGTGVAYISTVSENLQTLLHVSPERAAVAVGITYAVLSLFDRLRRITYLSLAALLVYAIIFGALVVEGTRNFDNLKPPVNLVKLNKPQYGAWFGVCAFAFGGFPIANVIRNDMQHKEDFPRVMMVSFAVCWIVYAAFATLGYVLYGEAVQEIIYMNFPEGSVASTASLVSVSVILSFSFVLQMTPIYMFMRPFFSSLHYAIINGMIVFLATGTAYLIPDVIFIISTMGAVGGEVCGFVLPALVYLKLSSHHEVGLRCLAICVLLMGFVGAGMAVTDALKKEFAHK
mmetsp:Transcript_35877/g.65832  ORF Transcript_35877/g.65832 Transcript_35877/m.65832 type:complete len:427 (+) Transcript_35877:116-1396(+)